MHRLRVRFAETDAMGVVHHGAYPLYLEAARVELLRAAGHPYVDIRADGVDFAVVDLAIGYEKPLYFDDEVVVAVQLAEVSRASFTLAYELGTDRGRCASARTRHAAVGPDGRPRRLPGWIGSLAPTPADEATPADPPPR